MGGILTSVTSYMRVWALRLSDLNAVSSNRLMTIENKILNDQMVSVKHERNMVDHFSKLISFWLSKYETSLKEDLELLADLDTPLEETASPTHHVTNTTNTTTPTSQSAKKRFPFSKSILYVRKGEKIVLHSILSILKARFVELQKEIEIEEELKQLQEDEEESEEIKHEEL